MNPIYYLIGACAVIWLAVIVWASRGKVGREPPKRPGAPSLETLVVEPGNRFRKQVDKFGKAQLATDNGWPLTFTYEDKDGTVTNRTVFPISMAGRMLEAWCYTRNDVRHFWLPRATNLDTYVQVTAAEKEAAAKEAMLPRFDPEPRKEAISAAAKFGWKVSVVFVSDDGTDVATEFDATTLRGTYRKSLPGVAIGQPDGPPIIVPFHRMRTIEVHSPTNKTRNRYRVTDVTPPSPPPP